MQETEVGSLDREGPSGEGKELRYSCLEKSMEKILAHGVSKESDTTEGLTLSLRAFLGAQTVKNLPAVQETWICSLGSARSPEVGNSNPLQYSCLKNPMDRGD
ncbi:unnamed protein product [Rangifer tarandus platyrhynchus]|uniref:Uncharacterized protein n=2 Tax=Rangifer tarandus platyrhynchus TaxID=3082113 RepID=A0ABN8ZX06_RANTA|nr:unnamed protein product [Rangifer tarandus platyrhynchus]